MDAGQSKGHLFGVVGYIKSILFSPLELFKEASLQKELSKTELLSSVVLLSFPVLGRFIWNLVSKESIFSVLSCAAFHVVVHLLFFAGAVAIVFQYYQARRGSFYVSSSYRIVLYSVTPYCLSGLLYPVLWFSLFPFLLSLYGGYILFVLTSELCGSSTGRTKSYALTGVYLLVLAMISSIATGSLNSGVQLDSLVVQQNQDVRAKMQQMKANSEHASSLAIINNMNPSGEVNFNYTTNQYEWEPN